MNEPDALELIEVVWIDSEMAKGQWIFKSDFKDCDYDEIKMCRSVGYLWAETEQFVTLVQKLEPPLRMQRCNFGGVVFNVADLALADFMPHITHHL